MIEGKNEAEILLLPVPVVGVDVKEDDCLLIKLTFLTEIKRIPLVHCPLIIKNDNGHECFIPGADHDRNGFFLQPENNQFNDCRSLYKFFSTADG